MANTGQDGELGVRQPPGDVLRMVWRDDCVRVPLPELDGEVNVLEAESPACSIEPVLVDDAGRAATRGLQEDLADGLAIRWVAVKLEIGRGQVLIKLA